MILLGACSRIVWSGVNSMPLPVPTTGKTGFVRVDGPAIGVTFTNRLTPESTVRNQNFMNGSGVALGDVDGDGRCDLYFAAIDGTNRLYRNLGGWRFVEAGAEAGVGLPGLHSTGAVLEDLDGDGDLDLVVTSMGGGLRLLRNDGKGRFSDDTPASGFATNTGATTVAIGDVDGNGTLDLYVANYGSYPILRSGAGRAQVRQVNGQWVVQGPYADRLRVVNQQIEEVGEPGVLYLNDGRGRFTAVPWNSDRFLDEQGRPKPPPADFGLSAVLRDVNGDGHPDLYACNDFQSPDRLWLNQGDGRFREAPRLSIRKHAFSSMGVDFGDLDRDGHLDFFVAEMSPREHVRRQRSLTGVRFLPNMPGRFEYRPEVPRNTLYRSNGDGSWSELAEFAGVASTDWSWQPLFIDVDLDGYEDLLVSSGAIHDVQDRDTLAAIQASGKPSTAANVLQYPGYPSPISAFRNLGGFRFEEAHQAWGLAHTNLHQGAALADLDGDGDLDLVCNTLNSAPALFRNESAAPRIVVRTRGTGSNTRGINARIRVPGAAPGLVQSQEMVSGGRYLSGDDALRVFAATGPGPFEIEVAWRDGRVTRVTNALANHLYVVEPEPGPAPVAGGAATNRPGPAPLFGDATAALGHTHHEELFDDYARQPLLHRQLSAAGPAVAWVDATAGERPWLVIGTGRGGRPGVFRADGKGGFTPVACDWTAPDDVAGMAVWTGTNGRPEVLMAVGNYETASARGSTLMRLALSPDGAKAVVEPMQGIMAIPASVGPLAVADFDADGFPDLFVGARVLPGFHPLSGPSRLFRGRADGSIPEPVTVAGLDSAGMVHGAVWSDLEGDGHPELVLACEWGPVRIWRNRRGTLEAWDPMVRQNGETDRALSSLTGWWTGVSAGDFDGDGRMDLVAGNWGLNTGYEASPARPMRLYHGQLGGTGAYDVIESYVPAELGREVPRRGRRPLTMALPALAEAFPTHAAFAEAGIEAVLARALARPARVQAVELRSHLFLNRGEVFEAVPLPAPAQWAPAFGISVADVDLDGNEDLLLAQNFFATRMEWPRSDAGRGLVLLGDGKGGFRTLASAESGVLVHGEQRGCAVADIDDDGRPDWIDTQNGAATRVFRNVSGRTGIRLRLKGASTNPAGIGAVIRVEHAGRMGAAREIRSGSGQGSVDGVVPVRAEKGDTIHVRWPGGATTRVRVEGDTVELKAETGK